MTQEENYLLKVSKEINRLLNEGIEIHPKSPIHVNLNKAIELAAAGQVNWIKCSERLPEMNGQEFTIEVLALSKDGEITVSCLYKSHDKIIGYGRNACGYNHNVTHWQPLPDLPTEKARAEGE